MFGTITVTRSFATSASPSAVWAALEAAPRWPEVLTDLVEARIEPDGVLAEGAIIRTVVKPGMNVVDMTYHVVAADPRLSLTIDSEIPGRARARTEYLIDPFAAGTRVQLTSRIEPIRWLHRFGVALARSAYTRQFEAALEVRMLPMLALAERMQTA
jgi:hypothetical protein